MRSHTTNFVFFSVISTYVWLLADSDATNRKLLVGATTLQSFLGQVPGGIVVLIESPYSGAQKYKGENVYNGCIAPFYCPIFSPCCTIIHYGDTDTVMAAVYSMASSHHRLGYTGLLHSIDYSSNQKDGTPETAGMFFCKQTQVYCNCYCIQ